MKDKVVIITGASSGIGLACAREFAARGARLVLAARSSEALNALTAELSEKGTDCISVICDVSVEADCKSLIQQAVSSFGRIDILLNNAGITMRALFEDLDLAVLKKLMDVNFWGTVYCTKFALPYLLQSKGTVAAVSSIAGFAPLPARTGYSASKYALHGFLGTLRIENMKKGLHVLIAAPGFTSSNIRKTALVADGSSQGETPRAEEKMMSAEEVAVHIANAIRKRKRSIVLTFTGKFTATAYKFFPRIMDRLIYNHMAKEPDSPLK